MPKLRTFSLIGVRADEGQILGSATDGVTMTIPSSEGVYFSSTGGSVGIRKDTEAPEDSVTWPADLPFTTEGYREAMGASELVPGLIVSIPSGVSVTGWVIGAQPAIT